MYTQFGLTNNNKYMKLKQACSLGSLLGFRFPECTNKCARRQFPYTVGSLLGFRFVFVWSSFGSRAHFLFVIKTILFVCDQGHFVCVLG